MLKHHIDCMLENESLKAQVENMEHNLMVQEQTAEQLRTENSMLRANDATMSELLKEKTVVNNCCCKED